MTSTWSTVVLLSLTCSLSLAIHDHVLESANNDFTGFKVDTVINWTLAQHSYSAARFTEHCPPHSSRQTSWTSCSRAPRYSGLEEVMEDSGEKRKEEKTRESKEEDIMCVVIWT